MAKSLRSKWKRKMKAIKRVRYGEKVSSECSAGSAASAGLVRSLAPCSP